MDEPEQMRVTMPIEATAPDGTSLGLAMVDLLGVVVGQRLGLWCHVCSLPSAVEVDINWVYAETLQLHARWVYAQCIDCGASNEAHPR